LDRDHPARDQPVHHEISASPGESAHPLGREIVAVGEIRTECLVGGGDEQVKQRGGKGGVLRETMQFVGVLQYRGHSGYSIPLPAARSGRAPRPCGTLQTADHELPGQPDYAPGRIGE
jgi:hypothetical protein